MPWEKPTPHHKWADELEDEAKAKDALRKAKLEAKNEDHSKRCPYCGSDDLVSKFPMHPGLAPDDPGQPVDNYYCRDCERLYRVKCPGTILLYGNPVIVEGSEHDE